MFNKFPILNLLLKIRNLAPHGLGTFYGHFLGLVILSHNYIFESGEKTYSYLNASIGLSFEAL